MVWIVFLVAVVFVIVYVLSIYNSLVTTNVRVEQSLKDIDVQLKKRYDLLPDLVETARKAANLDEKIFTEVAKIRSEAMQAQSAGAALSERAKVENQLTGMMRDLKVAVEAYPDIKSHAELLDLMQKVNDVEEKVAYSRQFYNSNVAELNTQIRLFPAVLLASALGFTAHEYFSAPEEEKKDVKVSLS